MAFNSCFDDLHDLVMTVPDGDEAAVDAVRRRDSTLTKPAGSLGQLEMLVEFLARWQRTENPTMDSPMVAIFAGNHGICAQGVSAFPMEVTAQMVANFTAGGAAISQICVLHGFNLRVFELALERPTGDVSYEAAMDPRECAATVAYGMEAIAGEPDLLCLGEMGIGNTTVAAIQCALLFGGDGEEWAGRGTGVDDAGLSRKIAAVDQAIACHASVAHDPYAVLANAGGREFAAMAGAIVAARHRRIPVIIDGFVATVAAAIIYSVNPAALDHCLFAHVSAEQAHSRLLEKMGKTPLLDLGMRLGEGSGAAIGAVLVKTALHLHQNMATFGEASVSERSELPKPN